MEKQKMKKASAQKDIEVDNYFLSTPEEVLKGKMPRLTETDIVLWTDYLGDYLIMWFKNGPKFFEDQKAKMKWLAFCPFLFGFTDNLPIAWIRLFVNQDVLHRDRLHEADFSPAEMATLEMADRIFQCCSDLIMENLKDLKEILNFIYEVEDRCNGRSYIDTNYALNKLVQLRIYPSIWNPLRRSFERKKKQAHQLILYFFKTIHHQIVHYGRDGQDKAELVRHTELNRVNIYKQFFPTDVQYSVEAHKALGEGRLEEALEFFTKAIKYDTLNSQEYCGRAEVYIQMKKFVNALPDCWRSIVLNQKLSSKSCYQASRCYFELGSLETAMEMNELAMDFCSETDQKQKKLIEAQSLYIEKAKTTRKISRYRALSEADPVEEEETSVVFRKLQCEGSSLFKNKKYNEAAEKFHEALEMVASFGLKALETQLDDVLLLNYCYGLACVHTGTFSNLQSAIEKFNHLLSQGFIIPSSHYGLGLAYKKLNRFSEALQEFQRAAEKRKSCIRLQWPQTLDILGETDPDLLQKFLKNLLQECKHPPKPDAICRFHSDGESTRTEIYLSDPDYKGFVRLHCSCRCCIEFHSGCWKTYRHNKGEHIDKEMLDKECPTPDCTATIVHISIFKLDIEHPIEMTSTKRPEPKSNERKPVVKLKATNTRKLHNRAEKKRVRKERREEDRKKEAEEKHLEETLATHTDTLYKNLDNDLHNLNATNQKYLVLVTKEQEDPSENKGKQKVTKAKKKKEKTKQVLTFDLQFAADKDKELLGVDSLDCDGQPGVMGSAPNAPSLHTPVVPVVPNMMPSPAIPAKPAHLGNGLLPLPLRAQPIIDVFLQNLIECFMTVLQGGPQDLDSSIVLDILSSVPSETRARVAAAGGIAVFLNSQPQFVVGAGKVGLARGGPGLLSNGPASAQLKIPNGDGAGLLQTPPVSEKLSNSNPWKFGPSAQSNVNSTQKGLLGAFPQLPLSNFLNAEKSGVVKSLNPSAQEFVPGQRKNSFDINSRSQNAREIDCIEGEQREKDDDDEEEEESGEFVMVTRKRNSQAKQLLRSSQTQKVPPYQNGLVHNVYSVFGDKQSSVGETTTTNTSSTSNLLHQNSVSASSSDSGKGSKSGSTPPPPQWSPSPSLSSAPTTTIGAMGPPPPLPIFPSVGALARNRTKSDASSTLSEEIRACSPNSSGSLVSQGSSNSNPTSSTAAQYAGIVPLQPLKGAGLSLPKRSKRRDLLREKVVSLPSVQPSLLPTQTSHNPSSGKPQGAMVEVDDIDSIDSSSTSDKDGLESASSASGVSLKSSLLENKVEKPQALKMDENVKDIEEWKLHLEDKKSTSQSAGSSYANSSNHLKGIYLGRTEARSSPPLQAAVGSQRHTESRVLRNLGMSSHSPSPPLTSHITGNHGAGDFSHTLDNPSKVNDKNTKAGHTFDSSGNFRAAMSGKDLWRDAEISLPSTKPSLLLEGLSSEEQINAASSKYVEMKDPWAKPSTQTAEGKFGLGDTLYGGKHFSKDTAFFPGHHDTDFGSSFLSQLQGSAEATFKGLSSPALLSTAGVASSDLRTWSPLSSDSLKSETQSQGRDKTNFQAWLTSLTQSGEKQDLDENPFALNLYKEKTPATQTRNKDVDSATAWASSLLQVSAQKSVPPATVSVNTELTGEKLQSLQLKFYETKQERDILRLKVEQEEKERSTEKAHIQGLESKLNEFQGQLQTREKELEESKQQARTAERDKERLAQALRETAEKVQQLQEVTGQLQREVVKGKGYQKQILNLTIQSALSSLEMRRKEGCSHIYKLDGIIHRIRNADLVDDPTLTTKKQEWEEYIKKYEEAIKDVMETHRSGTQALEEGRSLDDLLPLRAPSLPQPPKPPPEECLIGRPKPQPQSVSEPEPDATARPRSDSSDDDESAFLKLISQGTAPAKPEKTNPAPSAEAPPPMRLPPGLPRRPLSQGPIPLNSSMLSNLGSRPTSAASSSSSSSSSGLASIKLPSGRNVPRPSLASIAATMTPKPNLHQSQSSGKPKQLTIFDRLVRTVQETFPDYTSHQIQRIIEELRRENGGSLNSFNYDALAEKIVNRIVDREGEKTRHPQADCLHREESRSNRPGHHNTRPGSPTEKTCTICHEDTEPDCGLVIRVLDCGHRFHEDCIQSWLKVNQTCPNCRSHSLLEEDFPSLRKF